MKKTFFIIFLLFIFIYYSYLLSVNKIFFTKAFDYKKISQDYSLSQYVTGSGSSGIGDDGLYAFSGYYLLTGGDPSTVNFENPPLGKYLIGLSILLFHNVNNIYILYAFIILLTTYFLTYHLYNDSLISILSVVFLGILPLFVIQFIPTSEAQYSITLLDLPLTMFLLLGIFFFVVSDSGNKNYFISAFFLSLTFITKFFPGLLFIIIILTLYIWINQKRKIKIWLLSLLTVPLFYLVSYSMFFYLHPSLIEFINFQKYLISWRLGNPVVLGNIFSTIFTGYYKSWWMNGWIADTEWHFSLPLLVVLAVFGTCIAIKKKIKKLLLLSLLSGSYILYLSVGSVGVARYLVPVLPLLATLAMFPFKFFLDKLTKLNETKK